jgi:hypothetical protein
MLGSESGRLAGSGPTFNQDAEYVTGTLRKNISTALIFQPSIKNASPFFGVTFLNNCFLIYSNLGDVASLRSDPDSCFQRSEPNPDS